MGPLDGVRVVELTHEHVAWAGKLVADLGADVVVVEPPGGSPQRSFGPFLDDEPGPERSLWWWHYNTSKRSVVADLAADRDRVLALLADADVFIEGEAPGALADLGLDWATVSALNPRLVMVSITPFGASSARSHEPVTDLTLMAEAGPVWSCGYDDHSLPPVRGGGNQSFHTACNWAVMSLLVALLAREETGQGQHIDVSMYAASNVTTEMATYGWLACGWEVQRQTGRHAAPVLTPPVQVRCRDGRYATTGLPPRSPAEFANVLALLDRLGLRDEFPSSVILELGAEREQLNLADIETDPLVAEIFSSAPRGPVVPGRAPRRVRLLRRDAAHRARHRRHLHAGRGARRPALRRARLPGRDRAPRAAAVVHLPRRAVPLHGDAVGGAPRSPPRRALTTCAETNAATAACVVAGDSRWGA